MMASQTPDKELLYRYQRGNTDAFEQLYARYKNSIYHYFYSQVSSPNIADELHQDVWLSIIKSVSGFNQQASFKTWLYKIAHHRLIDYYRQAGKQALHLVQDIAIETEVNIHCDSPVQASQQHSKPDEALEKEQLKQALFSAIDSLPEEQKEVFLLYENSGLSLHEIASITETSFEGSKSRLRYAVKKLRQHMAQYRVVK